MERQESAVETSLKSVEFVLFSVLAGKDLYDRSEAFFGRMASVSEFLDQFHDWDPNKRKSKADVPFWYCSWKETTPKSQLTRARAEISRKESVSLVPEAL